MSTPRTVAMVVEHRYLAQSQPAGLVRALEGLGHRVVVVDPQAAVHRLGDDAWLDGLDIVVARGRSWALLCLLAWAESRGVPTINRKSSISAVHNKAEMSVVLAENRMPAPLTFFGAPSQMAGEIASEHYPLILKPIFGDNCRGLVVVESPDELARLAWDDPVALAQPYLPTDGYDLKLYGIGGDVWAVRKASPFNASRAADGGASPAEAVPLTDELQELGRRCGSLFGLELFGADCIIGEGGPLVIEVNDYPNYTAVPDADARLARYVVARAEEARPR